MLRYNEQTVHNIRVISGVVRVLLRELAFLLPDSWVPIRDTSFDAFFTPFWNEQVFCLVPLGTLVAFERNSECLRAFFDRADPGLSLREIIWNLLGLPKRLVPGSIADDFFSRCILTASSCEVTLISLACLLRLMLVLAMLASVSTAADKVSSAGTSSSSFRARAVTSEVSTLAPLALSHSIRLTRFG